MFFRKGFFYFVLVFPSSFKREVARAGLNHTRMDLVEKWQVMRSISSGLDIVKFSIVPAALIKDEASDKSPRVVIPLFSAFESLFIAGRGDWDS